MIPHETFAAPKTIGVFGQPPRRGQARLLSVLEEAFPVRFERRQNKERRGLDAALIVGSAAIGDLQGLPRLFFASAADLPRNPAEIDLAEDPPLDRRLRRRSFEEECGGAFLPLHCTAGDVAVATCGGRAVWTFQADGGRRHLVATSLPGLGERETLRHHLRPGRFLALLALVHFIRDLIGPAEWTPPPLRAAFLLDDPNLHWPTYGYVDYAAIAGHAAVHDYHLAVAMIPLDARLVHREAAGIFRAHPKRLSVLVHGNDHVHHELARERSEPATEALVAHALRRIESFERRTQIPVARVMAPPHGRCSSETAHALLRLGFDALCVSRPYPWLDVPPASRPLAGWDPAELVAGGLPVLPRYPLARPRAELAFRAFLGQPLILYGHHGDLAAGLESFAAAAADIGSLGDVTWTSLRQIALSNVATRRNGAALQIRMFTRRARIELPDNIENVQVEVPHYGADRSLESLVAHSPDAPPAEAQLGEPIPVESGRSLELALVRRDAIDHHLRWIRRRTTPWPVLRRAGTETRDRLLPLVRRVANA